MTFTELQLQSKRMSLSPESIHRQLLSNISNLGRMIQEKEATNSELLCLLQQKNETIASLLKDKENLQRQMQQLVQQQQAHGGLGDK